MKLNQEFKIKNILLKKCREEWLVLALDNMRIQSCHAPEKLTGRTQGQAQIGFPAPLQL